MKESLYSTWKAPIFKETFSDAFSVNKNNGTITGGVSFSNGIATTNGTTGYFSYPFPHRGTYSIRVKIKPTNVSTKYICDFRPSSGTGYFYFDPGGAINASSGTIYNNGVASTTPILNQWNDIVVSGISIISTTMFVGASFAFGGLSINDFELLEIYDYALTANEVLNLYQNKRYSNPLTISEILNVDAKNGVIGNRYSLQPLVVTNLASNYDFNAWLKPVQVTITGTLSFSTSTTANGPYTTSAVTTGITAGKTYLITMSGSTTATFNVGDPSNGYSDYIAGLTGTFSTSKVFTAAHNGLWFAITNGPGSASITSLTIQEVAPITVNSLVTPNKYGDIYTILFNNAGSKIDAGLYNDLTGDKTLIAWVNAKSLGATAGRIIDNGQFIAYTFTNNAIVLTRNNSGSSSITANNAFSFGKFFMLAITTTSAGVTNFYINGALSGSANQSAGTPVAGSNMIIGNNAAATRGFDGNLSAIRINSSILSAQDIQQLFDAERKFYNV